MYNVPDAGMLEVTSWKEHSSYTREIGKHGAYMEVQYEVEIMYKGI